MVLHPPATRRPADDLVRAELANLDRDPGAVTFRFTADGTAVEAVLDRRTLHARAARVAAVLRDAGALPGDRALLSCGPGPEFVAGLYGCLYAGVCAVPCPPPRTASQRQRFRGVVADAAVGTVLTTARARRDLQSAAGDADGSGDVLAALAIPVIDLDESGLFDVSITDDEWRLPRITAETLAFLQYTSGSTSTPKGVMVSHGNLVANLRMLASRIGSDRLPEPIDIVSWLPVFHDMGLIGGLFFPRFFGAAATLMPPEAFLQNPAAWLRQVAARDTEVGAAAPNFALDLCASRVRPEDLADVRLDHWHTLICGAEPVSAATLERFLRLVEPAGFPRRSLKVAFGLAEATLIVTAERGEQRAVRADSAELEQGRVRPAAEGDRAKDLVSCGEPCPGCEVAIVDPAGPRLLEPGDVGEVWVAGAHVARGYWGAPELSAETFGLSVPGDERRWMSTGDLGVLLDGELYIAGRSKDLIILRGRNIHPQDVELTAGTRVSAVRAGRCAAFSVPRGDEEGLVVVAAVDPGLRSTNLSALAQTAARISQAVTAEHEIRPHQVVLVRAKQIELTTSGKIRRRRIRAAHLAGELKALYTLTDDAAAEAPAGTLDQAGRDPSRQDLLDLAPAARRAVIEAWLRERVAALARTPSWKVDPELSLATCGLDSLRGSELRAQIAQRTGVTAPSSADTVRALAEAVEAGLQAPVPTHRAIVPDALGRAEPFPLTDLQHAYLVGRGTGYEYGGVAAHAYLEVDGTGLDLQRLLEAWRRLIARHDMLRVVITPDGRQRVLDDVPAYEFEVVDLRTAEPRERERRLASVREAYDHEIPAPYEWPPHRIAASLLPEDRIRLHLSLDLLAADLWSIRLLSEEWELLYRDPEADLPKLELGFRDWVLSEDAERDSAAAVAAGEYWRARIADLPPAPELPVQPPAPGGPRRFERRKHRIGADTWRALCEAALTHGVTPSVALLSAYSSVLGNWSRVQRFTVNATLFNRPLSHPQATAIVGDFTSVVPVAIDAAAPASFAELAVQTQQQLHRDLGHTTYSGVRVIRDVARVRGTAGQATFPVVFTSGLGLGGGRLPFAWLGEAGHAISQTPQVLLDHQVLEDGDGVVLLWDAATGQFPGGVLDDMFHAYIAAVTALAEPAAWSAPPLAALPRRQAEIRDRVNATAGPLPEGLLGDAFWSRAAEDPAAPALVAADRSLSRGELAGRARRLAADLIAADVRRGDVVAVAVAKGWSQVVAVLAITRIGAVYLPVAPDLPVERGQWLVRHSGAAVILAAEDDPPLIAPPEARTLTIPLESAWHAAPEPVITDEPEPDDLAYVLYTSGSTGTPKGVAVTHRAALNTCADVVERAGVGAADRVLGLSSLSFDLSVFDIFGVMGAGGTLVLPDPALRNDPAHWLDLVGRHGVTVWNSVPALLDLLVEYIEAGIAPGGATGLPLRSVLLSGDWIPVTLPGRLRALAPHATILAMGGATEAGIWSIAYEVGEVDPQWDSIPYGRPLRNQWFEVLNERLEPCPTWVAGELFIGGAGLAQGYWRDEERTAAAFITHPTDGRRLYRTGDLGRYLPDGTIQFLGREDFQVKIGGFRIELGEIEAALERHPGVRRAVAAAIGDRSHRRLVGYAVPDREQDDVETFTASLSAHLAESLPSYMVPHDLVVLPELPLTANGKIDRAALPSPAGTVKTRTELEPGLRAVADSIAEIVAEVLKRPRVDPWDNFFSLGGDSILGIQVVARIAAGGLDVTPRDLFTYQSIADLVAGLHAEGRLTAAAPAGLGPVPLTTRQRQVFSAEATACRVVLEVCDTLDLPRLERALAVVTARHDALRLSFADDAQTVTPAEESVYVPEISLDAISDAQRPAAVARILAEMAEEADPRGGPATKAAVLRLGPGQALFAWVGHRAAVDEASWPILVQDLLAAYRRLGDGGPPDLPGTAPSFLAWAGGSAGGPGPDAVRMTDDSSVVQTLFEIPAETAERLAADLAGAYRMSLSQGLAAALGWALCQDGRLTGVRIVTEHEDGSFAGVGCRDLQQRTYRAPDDVVDPAALMAAFKQAGADGPATAVVRRLGGPGWNPDPEVGLSIPADFVGPQVAAGRGAATTESCLAEVTAARVAGALRVRVRHLPHGAGAIAAAHLEQRLRAVAEHCAAPGAGALHPSDFPFAGLGAADLDSLLTSLVSDSSSTPSPTRDGHHGNP